MAIDLSPFWVHSITVQPLEGHGPYGDVYGELTPVPCLVEDITRQVRTAVGNTAGSVTLSRTTAYAPLGTVVPVGSLVQLPNGRTSKVIATQDHDGGGLPTPDHLEILIE